MFFESAGAACADRVRVVLRFSPEEGMGLRAFRLVGSLRSLVGVVLAGVALAGVAMGAGAGAALGAGDANEAACPNEASPGFRVSLPDCRAYEMVTPAEKNSAVVNPAEQPTVAADGSSLVGVSPEGLPGVGDNEQFNHEGTYYRFSRTASGWATASLNPYRGRLWSLGVGDSVWGPAEALAVERLRLRGADGSLSEIGPVWPLSLGPSQYGTPFRVLGAAAEASNGVVFGVEKLGFLWPFDSTLSESTLYEYTGTGNAEPSLVGVSGGAGSTTLVSQCGTVFGAGDGSFADGGPRNAISGDGSTVFFTALGGSCGATVLPANELFARIDGSRTVAISEPSGADCPLCDESAPANAVFQRASADGSKVFFTTTQPLLGHGTSENLYLYDFDPQAGQPKVVRVSGGDGSVSEPTAEVQSVTDVSEDGSHVYFIAKGVLTTAANSAGERAQAGGENFYVWERDAEYPNGRTMFIAGCGDVGDGQGENQVTPDGRFLVFTSSCRLTADDTSTARQVFQYDAQTGNMVRVSAGLEGYNDDGNATGGGLDARIVDQNQTERVRGGGFARTMSDDGSYVFFQSPVGLTSQAFNEAQIPGVGGEGNYAQNVYEFHDGRVWLIGSDSADREVPGLPLGAGVLLGVSASGGDVFFRTNDQLVPQDTDTQIDFYDARVDGGFPGPVVSVGCVGDACQGSQSAPPVFGVPSSVVFSGGGELAPPVVSGPVVAPKKALTVAQKLARALKACLKDPRRRRASCRALAKRRYGHSSRVLESDRRGK